MVGREVDVVLVFGGGGGEAFGIDLSSFVSCRKSLTSYLYPFITTSNSLLHFAPVSRDGGRRAKRTGWRSLLGTRGQARSIITSLSRKIGREMDDFGRGGWMVVEENDTGARGPSSRMNSYGASLYLLCFFICPSYCRKWSWSCVNSESIHHT